MSEALPLILMSMSHYIFATMLQCFYYLTIRGLSFYARIGYVRGAVRLHVDSQLLGATLTHATFVALDSAD